MTSAHVSSTDWPGSAFSGLWVDRRDAERELEERVSAGRIPPNAATQLSHFIRHGYAILPKAVPATVCAALRELLASAWRDGDERLLFQEPGSAVCEPVRAGIAPDAMRVVDMHAVSELARQALSAEPIVGFLRHLFDDDPLLFQSLTFERGSQQGLHQDTAYVVVSSPREMAASWIALEDIVEGSGELMYVPGSHRFPEYLFSGEYKHWNPQRDGSAQHDEWSRRIVDLTAQRGLSVETFRPTVGDVLIWAADLAHGGSVVQDPSLSRRSLVGHYCPKRVEPHYFTFAPQRRTVVRDGACSFSSYHVDLAEGR